MALWIFALCTALTQVLNAHHDSPDTRAQWWSSVCVFADPGAGVLHDHILSRRESGDILRIETRNRTEHIPASSSHTSACITVCYLQHDFISRSTERIKMALYCEYLMDRFFWSICEENTAILKRETSN